MTTKILKQALQLPPDHTLPPGPYRIWHPGARAWARYHVFGGVATFVEYFEEAK